MEEKHQLQVFRHRGYQPADFTLEVIMMFGDGVAPLNPARGAILATFKTLCSNSSS